MRARSVLALAALATIVCLARPLRADPPLGERDLLQRIFSPCCYRETLDVHESPIAAELRLEIHERLERGESPDRILADMVSRYGKEVLTRPLEKGAALAICGGSAVFIALLIGLALRRSRRAPPPPVLLRGLDLPAEEQRRLEDRLSDELRAED